MPIGSQVGGALALVALALAASQVFGLVKYLLARQWNGAVSTAVYFFATWGLLALAASSDYVGTATIPALGSTLQSLDGASLAMVSLGAFGVGGFLFDRTKARDNSQSAAEPSLLHDNSHHEGNIDAGDLR